MIYNALIKVQSVILFSSAQVLKNNLVTME